MRAKKINLAAEVLLHLLVLVLVGCAQLEQPPTIPASSPPRPESLEQNSAINIEQLLQQKSEQFSQCYQWEKNGQLSQDRKTNMAFALMVFDLDAEGKILKAAVEQSQLPLAFKNCLVQVIWSINFPAPAHRRPLQVRQPLNFHIP